MKASERKRLDYEKEKSILRANLKNNKQNMRNLIKQLRLYIMVEILYIAVMVCPKECEDTLIWFSKIPLEKWQNKILKTGTNQFAIGRTIFVKFAVEGEMSLRYVGITYWPVVAIPN